MTVHPRFVHKRAARGLDPDKEFLKGAARRQELRDNLAEIAGAVSAPVVMRGRGQRYELTFLMADRERTVLHFEAPDQQAAKKHACAAFMTERNAIGMRFKLAKSSEEAESDDDDE
jgi:hypothetical protein